MLEGVATVVRGFGALQVNAGNVGRAFVAFQGFGSGINFDSFAKFHEQILSLMMIKLDHIDNFEVSERYAVNAHALEYLRVGLTDLYGVTKSVEIEAQERFGNGFYMLGEPAEVYGVRIINYINWFSVSLISYARMVHTLSCGQPSAEAKKYSERVFPKVQVWRDKVGAHFSFSHPKSDVEALSDFSTSLLTVLDRGRFWAGSGWTFVHKGSSHTIPQWSLTEVFENEVVPRYFPDFVK